MSPLSCPTLHQCHPLVWVSVHSNIPCNCRANELARAGKLLPESSSIELSGNSVGTQTYRGSMRSPASLHESTDTWWIKGIATKNLVLVVTSYQPQWPFLHVIAFSLIADRLRKRRLLSTFVVSARLLLGSLFLVSLTELSSIDIKDIWFSSVG